MAVDSVVVEHPFAKPPSKPAMADTDTDVSDNTGQADASDQGDLEEPTSDLQKSKDDGITVHQYIHTFSDDQYATIIGKDAYYFLEGREDEVIDFLLLGRDVADDFKTLTFDQVKEVYVILIDNLINNRININKMTDEILDVYPFLKEFEAKRIVKTELARIIYYAKEMEAKRQGLDEYYYGWMGPLDNRTTPMCYYMQTGKLRQSDIKALHKAGHYMEELPWIPPEGMLLEDLKSACKQVAHCFGYEMISDWEMHINCRHTFARGNRALKPEMPGEIGVSDVFGDMMNYHDAGVIVEPEEQDDRVNYIPLDDNKDTWVFNNSITHKPTMYDGGTEDIYAFGDDEDEETILSTARMVESLVTMGTDMAVITYAIADNTNMSNDDIAYVMNNYSDIISRLTPYVIP